MSIKSLLIDMLQDFRTHDLMNLNNQGSVIYHLEKYLARINEGSKLSREEIKYIHLKDRERTVVDPHFKKMFIEGRDQNVYVHTKGV